MIVSFHPIRIPVLRLAISQLYSSSCTIPVWVYSTIKAPRCGAGIIRSITAPHVICAPPPEVCCVYYWRGSDYGPPPKILTSSTGLTCCCTSIQRGRLLTPALSFFLLAPVLRPPRPGSHPTQTHEKREYGGFSSGV